MKLELRVGGLFRICFRKKAIICVFLSKKIMTKKNQKTLLVMGHEPLKYDIFEPRLNKPISVVPPDATTNDVALVFQEMDKIKLNKKQTLEYFTPNNVALLLSIYKKSLETAKLIYKDHINPDNPSNIANTEGDKSKFYIKQSKYFCDYIEAIQTAIVFSYTALEAFANLSIPNDYIYEVKGKKGMLYQKEAIERWLPLKEKLEFILTKIYQTKSISSYPNCKNFMNLERIRNEIIHQKSIENTELFKEYFSPQIHSICGCSEAIIRFFYDALLIGKRTNPLWPWLIGRDKDFPIKKEVWENYVRADPD